MSVANLEVDLYEFNTYFCFNLIDIEISTEYMEPHRFTIVVRRLDKRDGWSADLKVLVCGCGMNRIITIGSSDGPEKRVVVETAPSVHLERATDPIEPTPAYSLLPCPPHQTCTRARFNEMFGADVVTLPGNLYAVGLKEGCLYIYNEWGMSEYFMIEACVQHIISVAMTYTDRTEFYFVMCAHDGFMEAHPMTTRTTPRLFGEMECVRTHKIAVEDETEYPVLHGRRWILTHSSRGGVSITMDVVDRHYFFHNLYSAFRSWHRGIPFEEKRDMIVFGGQKRGTRHNFTQRRDIDISPREYFATDRVSKKYVYNKGFGWIDRSQQIYFKYILDIDGNTSTWDATAWKLNSGSVIFKSESGWRQWFYEEYKPYTHYVPIKDDFSDLDEKFEWCAAHVDECLAMIKNCKALFQKIYRFSNVVKYTISILDKL